jgi:NAD dependent epimerase/dehydratase family enzyme
VHILITGGTGLIGRQLCRVLLGQGHELTVLSRNPDTVPAKCGAKVHAMAGLEEWQSDRAFDAIINLAGEPIVDARWTAKRKQVLWDSRVKLTEELVRRISAARHKPGVFLSGSAVGYYGNRGDADLDESAAAGNDFAAQLCKAWEEAARGAEKEDMRLLHVTGETTSHSTRQANCASQVAGYGEASRLREQPLRTPTDTGKLRAAIPDVRVCLLRTGLVLSRDGGLLKRMLLPFKLGLGARLGDGKQWMSWVHIDDYVAMMIGLLKNAHASGPYNMTAPQPVTNAEFTMTLAKVLHRPAPFIAPAIFLRPIMGERSCLLLEGQKVLPKKMGEAGFHFAFANLAEALHDLLGR